MGYVHGCNYGINAGLCSWDKCRSPLMGYVHGCNYGINAGLRSWDKRRSQL
jgi:hypothetical protein